MEEPNPETQKELGRKYRHNLDYFKKSSFLSREKFYLSLVVLLLGVYGIVHLESTRGDRVYNPGPLSIPHAKLESNCAACHDPGARDIAGVFAKHQWTASFFSSAATINQACQTCHVGMELHQPTMQTLALKDFHTELHVVTANNCFDCHREHLGRIELQPSGTFGCAACHDDADKMASGFTRVALPGTKFSARTTDGMTADGVVHFFPPQRKGPLPAFKSFEGDHPKFEYEQVGLEEPVALNFNHRLHLAPAMNLKCADCHKPADDGVYYRPITYQAACQRCHTLQLDPDNPALLLPHGNVAGLRSFLHSLVYQYRALDTKSGVAQALQRQLALQQAYKLLQRAHVQTPADLEHQIIFTADPYKAGTPAGQRPFFSGCAYCHQVSQPPGGADPRIAQPTMADRWLAHGAFTHARHEFMSCVSCHDAMDNREAGQIMMPAKVSCAECHREQGSAPSSCLTCHSFHAPRQTVDMMRATGLARFLIPQPQPAQ
jgi:mono/diheme cytochrome c family protein